jgi:hypothetical protein
MNQIELSPTIKLHCNHVGITDGSELESGVQHNDTAFHTDQFIRLSVKKTGREDTDESIQPSQRISLPFVLICSLL